MVEVTQIARPNVCIIVGSRYCIAAGVDKLPQCYAKFIDSILKEAGAMKRAWNNHGQDCGETLVEEGIVDRDIGDSSRDAEVRESRATPRRRRIA